MVEPAGTAELGAGVPAADGLEDGDAVAWLELFGELVTSGEVG